MGQELRMPFINEVRVAGRLVADPHPLEADGGRKGAAVTVAINRYVGRGKPAVTTFCDAVAWGELAEAIVAHCKVGSPVLISGSLATYERKNGKGPSKKTLQISIAQCQFLAAAPKSESSPDAE